MFSLFGFGFVRNVERRKERKGESQQARLPFFSCLYVLPIPTFHFLPPAHLPTKTSTVVDQPDTHKSSSISSLSNQLTLVSATYNRPPSPTPT